MSADPKLRPLSLEAVLLLQEGRFVDAIKVVREAESLGPDDAVARVFEQLSRDPRLRAQLDPHRGAARRKLFFWLVVVDVAIAAAAIYWFFFRRSI